MTEEERLELIKNSTWFCKGLDGGGSLKVLEIDDIRLFYHIDGHSWHKETYKNGVLIDIKNLYEECRVIRDLAVEHEKNLRKIEYSEENFWKPIRGLTRF